MDEKDKYNIDIIKRKVNIVHVNLKKIWVKF